jgi:hypothetical protein
MQADVIQEIVVRNVAEPNPGLEARRVNPRAMGFRVTGRLRA